MSDIHDLYMGSDGLCFTYVLLQVLVRTCLPYITNERTNDVMNE